MMADAPADGADLDALLAEAKVLVAEIRAWGHVSAKDCALLFGDLITALEAAREDKADWEQLLKATDAELDDMRDVANIECAEDAAIARIVRNPTQAEFAALGRAEWNARDILDRIVSLARGTAHDDSAKPVLDEDGLLVCLNRRLIDTGDSDVLDLVTTTNRLEVRSAEVAELRATIERVDDITLYGRWLRYEDLRDALNSPAKKETP
jgi:hypothetical protein